MTATVIELRPAVRDPLADAIDGALHALKLAAAESHPFNREALAQEAADELLTAIDALASAPKPRIS